VTSSTPPLPAAEYRAVVAGGTGAVGVAVMRELLASPRCVAVTALVRRDSASLMALPGARGKLVVNLIDMRRLESEARAALSFSPLHSVAFCTLGVGQPRKVSLEEHRRVDVEYAAAFARACRGVGVTHFSLLTSVGANARSRLRYLRIKGDAEEAVRAVGFARTSCFRPSLLVTPDIRYGFQDHITQWIVPHVTRFLPSRYHEIRVEDLGRAMRINADRAPTGAMEILEYADCMRLLATDSQVRTQV
jgi:uncharacterized protein YbjT (DUF2867 family)